MKYFAARRIRTAALLAAGLMLAAGVFGQGSNSTLQGNVTDPNAGGMGGVNVTVTSPTTGFRRSVTTERDGSYSIPAIPPGTYDVRFEAQGFKTVDQKAVELNVATTRRLDQKMQVSAVAEMVTVSSEAPLARPEPALGATISQKELETLPLNGRQFANLGALAPGTQLSYNTDPTKPDQLTISLDGGSGRNVNYVVDGGDNTDDTIGGQLQNYPLESVQEFKIQTQQYKAEYGRSSGGVLNVVTRSGTNEFHGGGFEYFRDKSLNSETTSEKINGSGKEAYRRNQYGASLGGPIVKDTLHFFATVERTERSTNYTVNTGGDIPAADGLVTNLPFRDELAAAKLTYDISAAQFLQVRFGYQKNTGKYGASVLPPPQSLGTTTNKYDSLLASHQIQVGQTGLNEFVFQYSKFDNSITPDSNDPTIYFPDGVFEGQNPNTPQHTFQTKYQFKDDYTVSKDIGGQSHEFKVGLNYLHEPRLGGDFSAGVSAPQYFLATNDINGPVSQIVQYSGFNGQKTPVNEFSAYLQDDWRPNARLTVNVGLRYDLWLGYDLNESSNPIYQYLATQNPYNDAPYYKDFRGWDGKLKNDHKNWAPRIGFAYDVTGQNRTFVHGGWGIYYDFPYTNATILFPSSAVQSNYGVSYQATPPANFRIGDPLPPNQNPSGVPLPNEVADPSVTKTPFTRQLSLGISHQVSDWLGVSLDLSNIEYRDLPFRFRANPLDPTLPGDPRRFPFGNFRMWIGGGKADYNGANVGFNARLTDKLRMQGFYTLSRITGNVLVGADEFRLTATDYQPDLGGAKKDVSINPLDPNCSGPCVGPLDTDARHKVTIGATYSAPWGINVSGVFRYRSATPFMIYESTDPNGDGYPLDLPPGVSHVNAGRTHSFEQADLSLSKEVMFGGVVGVEVVAQVFNIFNAKNPSGYRGNIGDVSTFDQPSRYAGDPNQGEQRLLQLGARLHF